MGDSDEEGYLAWLNAGQPLYQEGAGYVGANGLVTNMVPTDTAQHVQQLNPASDLWEHAKAQNTGFVYTPEQLGWSTEEGDKFRSAGNDMLPGFMAKQLIYSPEFRLSGRDPIATYNTLANGDINQLSGELSGARKAKKFLEGSGGDLATAGDAGKEAFVRSAFGNILNGRDSWWDRNKGAVIGVGGMLTVGLGGYLSGAMAATDAALVGGQAAAGTGGGGLFGTTAGLSTTGGTGLYGTGLGLEGAGLGGLYGTGVGASAGLGDLAAFGAGGALQGLDGLGGDVVGYNNVTPMVQGSDGVWSVPPTDVSGELATNPNLFGQSVSGGGLFGTGANLPVEVGGTGSTAGGLFGTGIGGSEVLGATGVGSAAGIGSSIWDSITNLLSPNGGGTSSTGGTNWASLLGPLLGVGGAVAGGVMGNNAIQDSIDKMQKYYEPFYNLGVSNIPGLNAADPTGGSGEFIDQLKNYGTNFQFDYNNPAYTQQLAETTRLNDQNLAARGMYNSRAALNLQDQSQRNLVGTEFDKQYSRGYGNLTDLFGMTNTNAGTQYNKLLDMVKIGAGSAGSAGQGALASGQSSANLWSGLGAMPMNYAILSKLLGGK